MRKSLLFFLFLIYIRKILYSIVSIVVFIFMSGDRLGINSGRSIIANVKHYMAYR